jgi:hypothetical protein
VPPAGRAANVAGKVGELVERNPGRAEAADVLRQPVTGSLSFTLEGAEDAVPDDQDAAVVAVEVDVVGAMMDALVRGRGSRTRE